MLNQWLDPKSEIYLEPGDYTIEFSDVDGYKTPAPMTINVSYNRLIEVKYEQAKFNFKILYESGFEDMQYRIVDANNIVDGKWRPFTEEVQLPSGTYVVFFSEKEKYKTPPSQTIVVNNAPISISVEYIMEIKDYNITFVLENVPNCNATLQKNPGSSGIIVVYDGLVISRQEGNYTLSFEDVAEYITPSPMTFDLDSDKTFTITYTKI